MWLERASLSALTVAGFFACALSGAALAQQPPVPAAGAAPAAPPAPGSALYGRPESEGAARLAPIAPPPIPTAADKLPVAKLKAPPGFKVEVFATGVGNARSLRIGDKGTVFVGSRLLDKVYALTEKDGKREVKVIASGLHRPNGLAYHKGALYVAELSKVWRYDAIEDHLDSPPKPTLVNDSFPKDEPHGWKFIAIGPDDKLYVPVGASGNINDPDQNNYTQIRRMNLEAAAEIVLRVGWASPAPGTSPCRAPRAHTAALGMRFYTGSMFPAEYRNST